MRKTALWRIPCAFFLIACGLNLIGCIRSEALAAAVKPALLPLLAVTTLAYLMGRHVRDYRPVALLTAAQLFGCAGDILLIPEGFFFFTGGIAAFLAGHVFYLYLFGGQSWRGVSLGRWLIALLVMAGAVFGMVKVIGIEGALLWPMAVYGFVLMLLVFSTLAGLAANWRDNRATWVVLLLGALLFTFSDSCIAMGIFGVMKFPLHHFLVMGTYLAAQSLLAIGGIRLIGAR